jgi:glycerol-3-phosphate acyltransferase PlsY
MLGYILGSIPFGYLVGKSMKKIVIREYGSGNIGESNVFRILGVKLAMMVLIGDCLKGFIIIVIAKMIEIDSLLFLLFIGIFVIIGHNWSVFLRFQGGKGIATTYGVILAIYPVLAVISALIWLAIVLITKYASLGSLISLIALLIMAIFYQKPVEFIIFCCCVLLLAIIKHHRNIHRLFKGKERKIYVKK